jgi:hypothetical protein
LEKRWQWKFSYHWFAKISFVVPERLFVAFKLNLSLEPENIDLVILMLL